MQIISTWLLKKVNWFAGCLAIAVLFGLIVFAANIEIKDMDLWLHLSVGKHIVENLSVPKVDFLSCTIAGKPWINHEWLFQAVVYSVYNVAGIDGLIDLKAGIVFLTFVILLFLGYTRERQLGPAIVLLLVLLVYQMRLTLRPDMFSLLFFVLYIFILGLYLDKRLTPWIIVLIQVIWVNTHGFFILGPGLIMISLLSEWIKRRVKLPLEWNKVGRLAEDEYRQLKWLLPLAILACLVNPYFFRGAWYPVGVLFSLGGESKVFFSQIQELQRPFHWGNLLSLQPYFYYRVLIVISFLSFVINRRKVDVTVFLIWLSFLIFSLSAVRNVVFFAFAAYFAFLANAQYLFEKNFLPGWCDNVKFRTVSLIALKVIFIVWILQYGNRLLDRGYYDFDKFERKSEFGGLSQRNFPHKAVDFLIGHGIKGNFFNDFNSGAYLVGRVSPKIKVAMDGRTEVYGVEYYKRHSKIWKGDAALFDEAADQYGWTGAFLNSVYVPAPEKLIRYLYEHQDWILVYFDYDATVFLRDVPENRQWIEKLRIDLSQWEIPDANLLKIGTHKVTPYRYINRAYALLSMGFPEKAREEAAEALRIQPYNAKAHKLIGKVYNEQGEYAEGFESLRKAKLIDPNDMTVRYEIAVALYHLGEVDQAKEQCQRVLAKRPNGANGLFLMSLIHAKQDRYEEAMKFLMKAHDRDPEEIESLLEIGDLFAEKGEFRRAKEAYEMALGVDATSEKTIKRLNELQSSE